MSHSHHQDKDKEKEKQPVIEIPVAGNISAGGTNVSADPAGVNPGTRSSEEGSPSSLAEQVQKLQAENKELMNTMVRRQADFENFRKRLEKERAQDRVRALEIFIDRILPVLDAFDRALAGQAESGAAEYLKGFEMIHRQLWDVLAKQGLTRIESVGKEFNPHFHHAIERQPTANHKEGEIIGELQPGYLFHDRVLRPAMVRVAAEPEGNAVPATHSEK